MPKRPQKSVASKPAAQAIRRAIRKSDLSHEPPTVGKPVIIDPDQEKPDVHARKKKPKPSD